MRMIVNPLTSQSVDSKRPLVFDWRTMQFVPGHKLILNPITLQTVSARKLEYHPLTGKYIPVTEQGERLIQNPLEPKKFILANKLVLNPLEGNFIPLRRGEKLKFAHQGNRFETYKKVPFSERIKDFWRRIIETIF